MKEFIPYEQALELKQLGFKEDCLDKYDPRFEKLSSDMQTWTSEHYPQTLMIPAPLYQQAFRWFREIHKLFSVVDVTIDSTWYFSIYNINAKRNDEIECEALYYDTYEEAELACLRKLIEIVKNKF